MGSVIMTGEECSIDVLENCGSVEMISSSNIVKINVQNSVTNVNECVSKMPIQTVVSKKKKSLKDVFEKFITLYLKKKFGPRKSN